MCCTTTQCTRTIVTLDTHPSYVYTESLPLDSSGLSAVPTVMNTSVTFRIPKGHVL